MRFARFGSTDNERPCLVDADGNRYDCSQLLPDWRGEHLSTAALQSLAGTDLNSLPAVPADERWASPVPRPGKVLCIGLNYADHAAESGMPAPQEPVLFMKAPNCVVGPYDEVLIPRGAEKTDWEVELAFVVGQNARYLSGPDAAAQHIAGYCICHDVSERHFQLERGGQWDKGKCCDTFCPLGPWVATADDIPPLDDLDMWLDVNGERKQTGNTRTMIFDCAFILHYLSQYMTLEAGDVVTTGTPPGVGLGFKPPQYLRAGDEVRLGISGLGEQRQVFGQA